MKTLMIPAIPRAFLDHIQTKESGTPRFFSGPDGKSEDQEDHAVQRNGFVHDEKEQSFHGTPPYR